MSNWTFKNLDTDKALYVFYNSVSSSMPTFIKNYISRLWGVTPYFTDWYKTAKESSGFLPNTKPLITIFILLGLIGKADYNH